MRHVRRGFCKDCRANVEHVRQFKSSLLWFFDTITFRFISRFRLGQWHCKQCTKKSIYLHLPRRNAKSIEIGNQPKDEEVAVESAGNFIRREKSIVARRERCKRFSAKYREKIVTKILEGHVTIAEVRRELNLSEQDILDWIAQAFEDQSNKVKELTTIIDVLTNGQTQQLKLETTLEPEPAGVLDAGRPRAASASKPSSTSQKPRRRRTTK